MTFTIITHVPHIHQDHAYWAYAPYAREMNLWLKHVDKVIIVAPLSQYKMNPIDTAYCHNNIQFREVPAFHLKSISNILKTLWVLPVIFYRVYKAMKQADHIHLRCPGNMGLIGVLVQMFFPNKPKTAKYAGNWDVNSQQPFTFRLQRWLLAQTFLTKNIKVLVYGQWKHQSKNIVPFFTATYTVQEAQETFTKPEFNKNQPIKCLFVGTLTQGKQPLYAIQLVASLRKLGYNIQLDLLGDGILKSQLNSYIEEHNLMTFVTLKGNLDREATKHHYQNSHFMMLPSKSEGWPKAVAEAMFWGCVPLVTKVSCVAYMLDEGNRGLLLTKDLSKDVTHIQEIIENETRFNQLSEQAKQWSQEFTLDKFEVEIKRILNTST